MPDWHPEDVKAALRKAGSSLATLARQHGVTRQTLSIALQRDFPKWEAIIADAIGVSPDVIWPTRFAARAAKSAARAALTAEIAADRARPRRRGRPPIVRQVAA